MKIEMKILFALFVTYQNGFSKNQFFTLTSGFDFKYDYVVRKNFGICKCY